MENSRGSITYETTLKRAIGNLCRYFFFYFLQIYNLLYKLSQHIIIIIVQMSFNVKAIVNPLCFDICFIAIPNRVGSTVYL
jgi:hypothetical protein